MFKPFQDRNPHFFGKISLSYFFMKSYWKQIDSILFDQITQEQNVGAKFGSLWQSASWTPLKLGFLDLKGQWCCCNAAIWRTCCNKILVLKDVCICWWKISNCSLKYFWLMWSFFSFYVDAYVYWCARKGKKCPFSPTVIISLQLFQWKSMSDVMCDVAPVTCHQCQHPQPQILHLLTP